MDLSPRNRKYSRLQLKAQKEFLQKRLVKYCEKLGVDAIPKIVYTRANMQKYSLMELEHFDKNRKACCMSANNVIYIALQKHAFTFDLDETLRHELIHYRFPYAEHGEVFNHQTDELSQDVKYPNFDRNEYIKDHPLYKYNRITQISDDQDW